MNCNCKKCDCQVDVTNPLRKGICFNCEHGNHINTPKEKDNFIEDKWAYNTYSDGSP